MKNIAIIISSLHGGGAERAASLLSMKLSEKYNVYIFVRDKEDVAYEYNGKMIALSEEFAGMNVTAEYALRVLKEKYSIDVSISFLRSMNYANVRSKGYDKVIVSERSTPGVKVPKNKVEDYLIATNYNLADKIVACSYGVRQRLVTQYEIDDNKVEVITNFINKEKIRIDSQVGISEEYKKFIGNDDYFISIGGLREEKRHMELIRIFSAFSRKYSNKIKLIIIGSGNLESRLLELIANEKMEDKIRIFPFTRNPFAMLSGAISLIVSSKFEGFPNVIMESFALGIPVISVDCTSGPRELIDGELDYELKLSYPRYCKRGILVSDHIGENQEENNQLIEAMQWMCIHGKERDKMSLEAHQYVDDYSNDKLLKKWVRLIEEEYVGTSFDDGEERERLRNAKEIYIYGSGKIGKRIFHTYSMEYDITAFIQSNIGSIDERVCGLPIITPEEAAKNAENAVVLFGVGEKYMNDVYNTLEKWGFRNIIYPF